MSSGKKIINSFEDPEQLKQFCESQYQTIVELSQELAEFKRSNEELKAKALVSAQGINASSLIQLDEQDQEIICRTQIALLRNRSMNCELTLEEARKLELYSKILGSVKPKPETDMREIKEMDSESMLLLVSGGKVS